MPKHDATINIAYSINKYTVTFEHKDAVLKTSTIGGQTYTSNTYELFNGESVDIPYIEGLENFKVVTQSNGTQKKYTLNEHSNQIVNIKYQQKNFNLAYEEYNKNYEGK